MPSIVDVGLWLAGRIETVRLVPVPTTAVLFQGAGRKR
jgi:2-polyprenyl-6-hydroxyphenyl methylase/3-demethylubiquinone-9 3-methyltransferase